MKKTIAILLVLMLAMTSAFAAFIQIGPTGRYQGDLTDMDQLRDVSNYAIGLDTRINLGVVDIAACGTVNADFKEAFMASTFTSVNARFDLTLLELSFGAGTDLTIGNNFDGFEGEWRVNGEEISSFFDVLKSSKFDARIAAGVNLGGLGLNVAYRVPFKTLGDLISGDYADVQNFNKGVASISLLLNIF
ncbi:MAG: hypothetical protein KBS81_09370 [Spirochaetales bacterium]|nr:hypothetical protein [Candidatus Physcosoma equi]